METIRYTKIIAGIALLLIPIALLESYFPIKPGLYVGLAELLTESISAWFIFAKPEYWKNLTPFSRRTLGLFFVSLLFADFWYIFLFYINGYDPHLWWTVLLTTYGYVAAFVLATLSIVSSFQEGFRKALLRPVSLIPTILFIPTAYHFIIWPYLRAVQGNGLTVYNIGQGLIVLSSFIAALPAFMGLISSRSLFWSSFALGILSLVFSDWALRVEVFNGAEAHFGFYEYFWAFGIFLLGSSAVFFRKGIVRIETFNRSSLLSSYKMGTLALILLFIGFLSVSQYGNIQAVKIVALGCSLGAILSTLVSHFLAEKVKNFSEQLGLLVGSEFRRNNPVEEFNQFQQLPLELSESFKLVLEKSVREEKERDFQAVRVKLAQTRSEMAAQVAHDIRSPLAALEIIARSAIQLPEDERILVRSAITRIRDIANNLLEKNRLLNTSTSLDSNSHLSTEEKSIELLSVLIEELLSEKRMQFENRKQIQIESRFDRSTFGLFADIQRIEFQRLLSNLIDNSAEAIESAGQIIVHLSGDRDVVQLEIIDNGRGIPSDVIQRLGNKGETYGKPHGSGLGLYHAKTCAESWGGSFKIISEGGNGTNVLITLRRARTPSWFTSEITLHPDSVVVILDDDQSIHQIWKNRFTALDLPIDSLPTLLHFSTTFELKNWFLSHRNPSVKHLFLCDYELAGEKENGLDTIEALGIQDDAILVTSRFEDHDVRGRCGKLGVALIPKVLSGSVPIVWTGSNHRPHRSLTTRSHSQSTFQHYETPRLH